MQCSRWPCPPLHKHISRCSISSACTRGAHAGLCLTTHTLTHTHALTIARTPTSRTLTRPHPPHCQLSEEFEARWAAGQVPGWEDKGVSTASSSGSVGSSGLDLDAFDSVDELEVIGRQGQGQGLRALVL